MDRYILNDQNMAVPCADVDEWQRFMDSDRRFLLSTDVEGYRVSTVFLGVDFTSNAKEPLLFESMVRAGKGSEDPEPFDRDLLRIARWPESIRSVSYDDAAKAHQVLIDDVQRTVDDSYKIANSLHQGALEAERMLAEHPDPETMFQQMLNRKD